jgi:hypothetical protein
MELKDDGQEELGSDDGRCQGKKPSDQQTLIARDLTYSRHLGSDVSDMVWTDDWYIMGGLDLLQNEEDRSIYYSNHENRSIHHSILLTKPGKQPNKRTPRDLTHV